MNLGRLEQLLQLRTLTWDGYVISKGDRDALIKAGYAQRMGRGWNMITKEGVIVLDSLGLLTTRICEDLT